MEKQNLSHLKVGDKIACTKPARCWNAMQNSPRLSYEIFTITKRTKTQIKYKPFAHWDDLEYAARVIDGMRIGDEGAYSLRVYFIEATAEILERHEAEKCAILRHQNACKNVDSLIGKSHAFLDLTTEQLEALGKACAEIQAMVK